ARGPRSLAPRSPAVPPNIPWLGRSAPSPPQPGATIAQSECGGPAARRASQVRCDMGLRIYCALGVALYMLLSLADLVLTTALLRGNRAAYEANPLAAACLESHGWRGLAVYKAGGVAAFLGAIGLLTRRRPRVAAGVVTFGCLVMLGVTGYSHRL